LTTSYSTSSCTLGTENKVHTNTAGLCSTISSSDYDLSGTVVKYYTTTTCSASAAAPTLSPSAQLFPGNSIAITGTGQYLYKNYYSDISCTKPSSGQAYPLNVCKPYILENQRKYRIVTAAVSGNTTSVVYYRFLYFDDSACTLYSSGYTYKSSSSIANDDIQVQYTMGTMTGVTGTCQPSCKRRSTSTMAGVTTSLSSVMPSSGQLIPTGYTAVSTSGYLQQITYQDSACTNVINSFGTQLNTCFNLFGGLFAMYTAGSMSSSNMYSLAFGLYADAACTQMVYYTDKINHYFVNSKTQSTCTTINSNVPSYWPSIGKSQKMMISTSSPSFPSTGAVVK
jgi:hypothetical protein